MIGAIVGFAAAGWIGAVVGGIAAAIALNVVVLGGQGLREKVGDD